MKFKILEHFKKKEVQGCINCNYQINNNGDYKCLLNSKRVFHNEVCGKWDWIEENFITIEQFIKEKSKKSTFHIIYTNKKDYLLKLDESEMSFESRFEIIQNSVQSDNEFISFDKKLIKSCYSIKKVLDIQTSIYYIEKVHTFGIRLKDIKNFEEKPINYIII